MYSFTKHKLNNSARKIFFCLLIFRKKKILNNYKKGVEDLKDKIDIVKNITLYVKNKNWDDIYKIWNVVGFILMTSLDIKLINEKLLTSKGYGRNEFIIKSACILVYEILEDIEQILGKEYYLCLNKLSITNDLIDDLNKKKKELSKLKSLYHKDLKIVRTIIGAHRDHDFLTQLEVFSKLETTSILVLLNKFEKNILSLSEPLEIIINQSAENFIKNSKL